MTCCREVARLAIGAGHHAVGDLADQCLHEPVLASLRRTRIGVRAQELPLGEGAQPALEIHHRDPRDDAEAGEGERLPEHGRILEDGPVRGLEGVEPARDERGQGLRDSQVAQVAGRSIDIAVKGEFALGQEHPDRFDRVQRDPVRAGDDRLDRRLRQPGDQAGEQVAHRRRGQRLEIERGEVALARAPVGPLLEQFRPAERHHVDRRVTAPLHQVVDEVDEAGIGEVEVLEDEDDRGGRGEPLEECPPRPEELLRADAGLDAEQGQEGGLDPAAVVGVRNVLGEHRRDARSCRGRVVRLEQPRPPPDHLAERPEADPVAIRRVPALVEPDRLDEAVRGI